MRILFVNPSLRPHNPRKFFPIGLGYVLTGVKKAGFLFDLLDIDAYRYSEEYVESFFDSNRYDVVAFGCLVTHFKWVKHFTDMVKAKQPECRIVAGNSVASSIPEILLRKTGTDIAVLGEGDITIVELLSALEKSESLMSVQGLAFKDKGEVIFSPKRSIIMSVDDIPFPDREIFPISKYLEASQYNVHEPFPMPEDQIRSLNINSARGCPFKCTFCYHVFITEPIRYRWRSPQSVVEEIRYLKENYGINYIQLWDELTFASKKRMDEFSEAILAEDFKIFWTGSTLAGTIGTEDIGLAKKLKRSGCLGLGFSLESANADILKHMNKKINLEKYAATRAVLRDAKIATFTSVVFGFPEETPETIEETINFCISQKVSPSAGFVLPMPMTHIYQLAKDKKLITDEFDYLMRFGDRQDLHVNLTEMSNEVLLSLVKSGTKRCQEALGIHMDDPMKTLRKRSRDEV